MSIRDTSGQDQPVSSATLLGGKRRRWLVVASAATALVVAASWLVTGWSAGSRSIDGDRMRIAEVTASQFIQAERASLLGLNVSLFHCHHSRISRLRDGLIQVLELIKRGFIAKLVLRNSHRL